MKKRRGIVNWIILGTTLLLILLSIILGTSLYVSKNVRKSIEYAGGFEVLVEVNDKKTGGSTDESTAQSVADNIDTRLRADGYTNPTVLVENADSNWYVRVRIANVTSDIQREEITNEVSHQPVMSIYDENDKPLFDTNGYNSQALPIADKDQMQIIKSGSAHYTVSGSNNPKNVVAMSVASDSARNALQQATTALSSGSSTRGHQMFIWLDHDYLTNIAKTYHPTDWAAAGNNLNKYAYISIGGKQTSTFRTMTWYENGSEHSVNFEDYLISSASVDKPLTEDSFIIQGNFTINSAKKLASNINFGLASYSLSEKSSHFVAASYGSNAFTKAAIAGIIVFSLIAIFMIVNYGLLGALTTISLGLFIFLTLLMFTVMKGEYSPSSIGALILGIGMAVDANIITYERLKIEIFDGSSVAKAFNKSNKTSISTIVDANITTIIVAFVLFYFGTHSLKDFSITLILSIGFTLLIMLAFTRFLTWLLVRTNVFKDRLWLLGIKKQTLDKYSKQKPKYHGWDYIKSAKWFVVGSVSILMAGLIVFSTFAGINGTFGAGFNRTIDFSGGAVVELDSPGTLTLTQQQEDEAEAFLRQHGIDDISYIYNSKNEITGVSGETQSSTTLTTQLLEDYKNTPSHGIGTYNFNNVTSDVATKLAKNALYAIGISFIAIIVYTMVRFKWTYSIAAILALIHDGLIIAAIFIIGRIKVNPVFVAALLSIIGYSINDTIVTFDKIRDLMKEEHRVGLTVAEIKGIANKAIGQTIKRSLLTSMTTLSAIVILMSFNGATDTSFNLAMFFGMLSGTYSSIFIASYSWIYLERMRQKRLAKRKKNKFWKLQGVEEQTIKGVNEY
ncbi:MAG: protein translocase subunit SecDF [Mycoplasma sp.]|nr:protein translocase subunit SecDF [Mycoplasma sp.]